MRAWLAIALMMLTQAAHAADVDKPCDLTITFSSKCCGTDHETYQKVKTMLDADRTLSVRRIPWGREGDFTLCVSTMSQSHIQPLYDKIKPVLPAPDDSSRGTTTIRMKDQLEKK